MTNIQLLQYYVGLLILQYAGMPKFQKFIQLVANQSTCDGLFLELQNCFNLNTAVGAQLTVIGKLLGVPRNVYGIQPYATYFSFTRATTPHPASVGFNRATTPIDPDFFLRANINATYTMTDFEMLNVIKLKIIYNYTYSSFRALKIALYNTFAGGIDILAPNMVGGPFFNFTRAAGIPASNGFNRANVANNTYFFQRAWQNTTMTLPYQVKQPYFVVVQIAQFLNILPHSSGVNPVVNYIN